MQLRDQFLKFRRNMLELETELYDEDVSIGRKLKISKEIQTLAAELWPDQKKGYYKETLDITGFLVTIPNAEVSMAGMLKLLKGSSSVEMIMRAFRRRKIRILLKTKRQFLRTRSYKTRISSIFDVSPESVRESIG